MRGSQRRFQENRREWPGRFCGRVLRHGSAPRYHRKSFPALFRRHTGSRESKRKNSRKDAPECRTRTRSSEWNFFRLTGPILCRIGWKTCKGNDFSETPIRKHDSFSGISQILQTSNAILKRKRRQVFRTRGKDSEKKRSATDCSQFSGCYIVISYLLPEPK